RRKSVCQSLTSRKQVFEIGSKRRSEPGRSPDIHWPDRAGRKRTSRRIELESTRQPQNSENGGIAKQPLAESRFRGVWREPVHNGRGHCDRVQAQGLVTRMSLAGYCLAGWSPPEPASASPAEK